MSKNTQLAKLAQKKRKKPTKARGFRRPNPAFMDSPLVHVAGPLAHFASQLIASILPPPEPPPWWCNACKIDLRILIGGPAAGAVPFCPSCRGPMVRKGAGVKLDGDGALDATCEDVTYKRLGEPAEPTKKEKESQ